MMSRHAEARCQQRGISNQAVDILLSYGERGYHRGAEVYYMNKVSRQAAKQDLGERGYLRMAGQLNTYLVVSSDGTIITACRRLIRLKF